MSVLIKDMEKPKSCYAVIDGEYEFCPFVNTDDDCVLLLKKGICEGTWEMQYSKCPLVEVPELCEDALKKIKNASFVGSDGLDYVETLQALDALKDAIGVTLHVTKISKHCSDFSDLDEVIECEDVVSRRILLNDLKELITAWEKYPVMAEQIKGVETAIGYVKTIPSVTPKRKTGRWIDRGYMKVGFHCSECGGYAVSGKEKYCPNCGADMRQREENK